MSWSRKLECQLLPLISIYSKIQNKHPSHIQFSLPIHVTGDSSQYPALRVDLHHCHDCPSWLPSKCKGLCPVASINIYILQSCQGGPFSRSRPPRIRLLAFFQQLFELLKSFWVLGRSAAKERDNIPKHFVWDPKKNKKKMVKKKKIHHHHGQRWSMMVKMANGKNKRKKVKRTELGQLVKKS